MSIIMKCLKEPTFNQLRTKEQLGYIVSARYESSCNVCLATFVIQSSKFGADYLEHRLNDFLTTIRSGFDEATINTVKEAQIKALE